MNATGLLKHAGAFGALAICAACGNGWTLAPSTAALDGTYTYVGKTLSVNGRLVTAALPPNPLGRYGTTVPDRHVQPGKFEYIDSFYDSHASIFNYPKSNKQIGTITGVGGQGCTNVLYGYGKETFWIVAGNTEISEYKVPKTRIKRLSDSIGMPSSCAMNTSGDLAVGILSGSSSGDVVIFKNASGTGKPMMTPLAEEYFDGYDNQGNLFADGFDQSDNFALVELPKGGSSFKTITTSNTVQFPGSVQWDGKYLTVLDQRARTIYQYVVKGTKATVKGKVSLSDAGDCAQTWIVKGLVYCAGATDNDGEVFRYPAGGKAIAVLDGKFKYPLGVTVSEQ